MKEFENIQTGLPYKESPEYVEQLVKRCQDAAVEEAMPERRIVRPWFYGVASVAVAAAIAVGVFLWPPRSSSPDLSLTSSPMDTFLASLSDEEAAMIVDWPIDDIPECY